MLLLPTQALYGRATLDKQFHASNKAVQWVHLDRKKTPLHQSASVRRIGVRTAGAYLGDLNDTLPTKDGISSPPASAGSTMTNGLKGPQIVEGMSNNVVSFTSAPAATPSSPPQLMEKPAQNQKHHMLNEGANPAGSTDDDEAGWVPGNRYLHA